MLVQYVRNEKGEKIGCVVAESPINIGWSLCHKTDRFDKSKGKMIAHNRAEVGYPDNLRNHIKKCDHHTPPKLKKIIQACSEMSIRAKKYYKGDS